MKRSVLIKRRKLNISLSLFLFSSWTGRNFVITFVSWIEFR